MLKRWYLLQAAVAVLLVLGRAGAAGSVTAGDAEAAKHGFEAARHTTVATYTFGDVRVVQMELGVLSHYSYVVFSGKECLIVDPDRDVEAYLDLAKKEQAAIAGVFLTHSHADFVAGHLELANAVGCPIYQNASSGAAYAIKGLADGSAIPVGAAVIKAIETPGHTPDGLCGALYVTATQPNPAALLTGDTLFVGSVGRPDLLEGTTSASWLAGKCFDTWHEKLSKLPDAVVVLPAHGAGSLCGAHLSDKPSSTIGEERASNPYLKLSGRSEFIAAVIGDLSEPPQYFKHNAAMNRQGPPLVVWKAPVARVRPDPALADRTEHFVVDLRDADSYAAGHIPNSVNIGLRGRLETWVGIMVPWGAPLVLAGEVRELEEAAFRLHRVGYRTSAIDIDEWKAANLPLAKSTQMPPAELRTLMQNKQAPVIVDVRLPAEWMGVRIGTVVNLPLNHLAELSAKLEPEQPVVTVCNSAYRSSMAVGILEAKGFTKVASLDGGTEAWVAAGYPVFGADSKAGAAGAPTRKIRLADRLSAAELKRLLMDLPGTFDLVDIRPAPLFADYNLPGSRNADIADVLDNAAYLTGAGPLVIVDRDGSLAMQVAGILSQKTERRIQALHGGLEAYWSESELHRAVKAVPIPAAGAGGEPAAPAAPSGGSLPTAKKRSAGC